MHDYLTSLPTAPAHSLTTRVAAYLALFFLKLMSVET